MFQVYVDGVPETLFFFLNLAWGGGGGKGGWRLGEEGWGRAGEGWGRGRGGLGLLFFKTRLTEAIKRSFLEVFFTLGCSGALGRTALGILVWVPCAWEPGLAFRS